jgi:iron-sulfur cluster repair protein YtfE (RIC family)
MKITAGLLGEHAVFYAQFDHLDQVLPREQVIREIKAQGLMLESALAGHANIEEELLFQALDLFPEATGPLNVMRMEHEEIEGALGRIPELNGIEESRSLLLHVVQVARQHFAKEEQILFKLADQLLGDTKLAELGLQWAERRGVMV